MELLNSLYRHSFGLLTDFYQITMAYAHWKAGTANQDAVFHLTFRKHPFKGGFAVCCGLDFAIDYLKHLTFDESDIAYLRTMKGGDDKPLFDEGFLKYLASFRFTCDVDAIAEGTVVFPHEPLIRVQGPIIQCQIVETALINILGFQTLVASKAARLKLAAQGDKVFEFGLRRAQGPDGGITASRAAYIGGCDGTSNVLAGKLFGMPVVGTIAHSWVMSFDDELESFKHYAEAMPNNCVLLVDTYDTLEGVRHAVTIGQMLRKRSQRLAGIRLDSGDLAYLSIEARKILDEAGFHDTVIIASNDLDEQIIESLKQQGATIAVWAVGTKLVTAYDQPALGAVYKLSAVRKEGEEWSHRIKLSEQAIKISTPGIQQVRRYSHDSEFYCDMIYDVELGVPSECRMVDPLDPTRMKIISPATPFNDLLVPIMRNGKVIYQTPDIREAKQRTAEQLSHLHSGVKRFVNPHQYPVGIESSLHDLKTKLTLDKRGLRP